MQKSNETLRTDGRRYDELRNIKITYDIFENASGSVLFELGKTKILCAVTIQNGVPPFLRGKGTGWLMAEYAMLPASTAVRIQRESTQSSKNGRSVEISRFIARALRSIIDLDSIGERTIVVDCDVLQADGGTRTASIMAAHLALNYAQKQWLQFKTIEKKCIRDGVIGISVGAKNGRALLDLNYEEDSSIEADFNFVVTQSGDIIEIQGGAEKNSISWGIFDQMRVLVIKAAQELFDCFEKNNRGTSVVRDIIPDYRKKNDNKVPLFSLIKRQQISAD